MLSGLLYPGLQVCGIKQHGFEGFFNLIDFSHDLAYFPCRDASYKLLSLMMDVLIYQINYCAYFCILSLL